MGKSQGSQNKLGVWKPFLKNRNSASKGSTDLYKYLKMTGNITLGRANQGFKTLSATVFELWPKIGLRTGDVRARIPNIGYYDNSPVKSLQFFKIS